MDLSETGKIDEVLFFVECKTRNWCREKSRFYGDSDLTGARHLIFCTGGIISVLQVMHS